MATPSDQSSECPRCGSPHPHLHPAMQFEGEVQPCTHYFHRRVTSQNTPERIAEVDRSLSRDKRAETIAALLRMGHEPGKVSAAVKIADAGGSVYDAMEALR